MQKCKISAPQNLRDVPLCVPWHREEGADPAPMGSTDTPALTLKGILCVAVHGEGTKMPACAVTQPNPGETHIFGLCIPAGAAAGSARCCSEEPGPGAAARPEHAGI